VRAIIGQNDIALTEMGRGKGRSYHWNVREEKVQRHSPGLERTVGEKGKKLCAAVPQ